MKRSPIFLSCVILLTAACSAVVPQPVKVEGIAMLPALREGDRIIIDRNFDKLERGDIVVFYFPMDQRKSYLKRIIALPNDTVEIREGQVFINRALINEPYIDPQLNITHRSSPEIKLTPDQYYVMGDNRDNSSDSRIWGPLDRKFIYGKYVKKYYSSGP
ncbi:MAG TPA: signal peptidase I [Pyrinomonadaceae bacterium]|jgi:signal peptidase I|nr:signal peptidase I [Pyrinomonadaceae bacterium]